MITETEDYIEQAYKTMIKLWRDIRVEISTLSAKLYGITLPARPLCLETREDLCQCGIDSAIQNRLMVDLVGLQQIYLEQVL